MPIFWAFNMIKCFSFVALFALTFLSYCGYKLDYLPFIYLHEVPQKLSSRINTDYHDVLISKGIQAIRIGSNNDVQREKCVVEVTGEYSEDQVIQNPKVGVIYINVTSKKLRLYWRIPPSFSYNDAVAELSSLLNEVIAINDETRRLKRSFE